MNPIAIVMHPDTLEGLKTHGDMFKICNNTLIDTETKFHLKIFTYHWLPKTAKFPKFPDWPFTTWEAKDAEWAVPLGIAVLEDAPYYILLDGAAFPKRQRNFGDLTVINRVTVADAAWRRWAQDLENHVILADLNCWK